MANETAIEWTDLSWNSVHGCSIVSTECKHCYAMTLSLRYRHTLKPWIPANAAENVLLKPHKLREPLSGAKAWRGLGEAAKAAGKADGKLVFVNSMSDLFHEQIPDDFIADHFGVMAQAPQHTFQILTKRPERMARLMPMIWHSFGDEPLPNVWLGVSIGLRHFVHRADLLRQTPAAVRFISAEPLLGPLAPLTPYSQDGLYPWLDGEDIEYRADPGLDLTGIDWLIVGGESGPNHRPMKRSWVVGLLDTCLHQRVVADGDTVRIDYDRPGTRFFFKQWGGARPGGEALLDGREWREFPMPAHTAPGGRTDGQQDA